MSDELSSLAELFDRCGVAYAVIGAHAVNVWVEPRATANLDVTVYASPEEQRRIRNEFEAAGYGAAREDGAKLPSGPDFVRFVAEDRSLTVEIQTAKTQFQRDVAARARRTASGLRIATPEDLIVLKLIAYRPKDRLDLLGLMRLHGLDWNYVERWAAQWQVQERLEQTRASR
jgi:hypothetical protein